MKRIFAFFICFLHFAASGTDAAESLRAYVSLERQSEPQLRFALDYAERLLSTQKDAEFQLFTDGRGVPLLLLDSSPFKEEILALGASYPRLKFNICIEALNADRGSGGFQLKVPKVIPGTELVSCTRQFRKLSEEGWFRLDAAEADK